MNPSTPSRSSQQPQPDVPVHICRPEDARRAYPYVYRKLGKVYNSPQRKRPIAKHSKKVVCPLKTMKKVVLESRMASLILSRTSPEPGLQAPTEEDQMDVFMEDGGMVEENGQSDRQECVSDEEDEDEDGAGRGPKKAKRDTKAEAQRLYESWSKLVPTLSTSLLTYISKSTGKPTSTTFDTSPCRTCNAASHSSTRIICLFWDRKYYSLLSISYSPTLYFRSRHR